MAAPPVLRPVACIAALNAAAQGLLGAILDILALCICFCGFGSAPQAQANDFAQYLTFYLQGDECGNHSYQLYSGLTSPTGLRVWITLSLFFSASMFASSIALFLAVVRHWSDEKLQISLVSWLFINSFTAIDDVILGYIFGNDYLTAESSMNQQDNVGSLTLGVVTFFAARGVYLWVVNVAFMIYLFKCARSLHKILNEQVPRQDQDPIENWPSLDDFGKAKGADIDRTPTAINPRLTNRLESTETSNYPEYSAMSRWPTLNGQAQTMRESRPREVVEEQRSKTVREHSLRRQGGIENPAYEEEGGRYYMRLQSETGSSRDYDGRRDYEGRRSSQLHREQSRREVVGNSGPGPGRYKNVTPPPPVPSPEYTEENGVPIPPIDYLDPPESTAMSRSPKRPLSLQEAILDRTIRLKKVPDELKRGINK